MSNTIEIPNIPEMLKQREERYGSFESHSILSQNLQDALRCSPKWQSLPKIEREALIMICHKMARILNGEPLYPDNWVDICGYSQLVVNYLVEEKPSTVQPK
jgi:nucleoid-associated protein YejK